MSGARAEAQFLVRFGEATLGDRLLDRLGVGIGLDPMDLAGMDPFGMVSAHPALASREFGVVEVVDRVENRIVWRQRDDIEIVKSVHTRITHALREVSTEAFRAEWDIH